MSYRKKHIKTKIHKIRPKRSLFTRLWFWLVILFIIFFLLLSYFVVFYPGFQILNLTVSGNEKVSSKNIEDLIFNKIDNKMFSIFQWEARSRSIFLVDNNKLSRDLLEEFPGIEKTAISKKFPQTLVLVITERKPLGAFCTKENQCFLIDDSGVIFEALTGVPVGVTIVRQLVEDGEIFTGKKVIEKNIIDAIYTIQKNLKDNFQIDLKDALVSNPLRLDVKTIENWKIYFDLSETTDIGSQIAKLGLLLNNELTSGKRGGLRYIDLRPKDRAIVCDNSICGE